MDFTVKFGYSEKSSKTLLKSFPLWFCADDKTETKYNADESQIEGIKKIRIKEKRDTKC